MIKDGIDTLTLHNKVRVITTEGELFTSPVDLQIAFKRFVLKSPKDFADANHLQKLFEISEERISHWKGVLEHYGRI